MTQHIRESDAPLAFLFPGLHEGARSDIAGAPIAELAQTQIALAEAESDQVLLRAIANCSLLCPATPQMAQSAARLTIGLQPNDIVDENGEVAGAVTALAYLLAALNDAENAKLLVGKLLLAGPTLKTSIAVIQAAHTLVVLASAHAHTSERQTAIEVGVSAIAFGVETGHCATGLLHLIDAITAMEPKLRPGLAQARIASTLLQDAV